MLEKYKKGIIQNFGINDVVNSSNTQYYKTWKQMIERTNGEYYKEKFTTYDSISVCKEWAYLSQFKQWFDVYYIKGYQLDKDLLIPNNTIYSPDTCLFLPRYINNIIRKKVKGIRKNVCGNFQALAYICGGSRSLGTFSTEKEAYSVHLNYKIKKYLDIADTWIDENPKILLGIYRQSKYILGDSWDTFIDNNPYHYYPDKIDINT